MEEAADRFRERLVRILVADGVITDSRVAAAMRAVRRHAFVPGASLGEAYEDGPLPVKFRHGVAISTISQPRMVAIMLELARLEPGDRVLEVGTGSGYNAALMAELVGTEGRVVTVELEEDLAIAARRALINEGYGQVTVIVGDGSRAVVADGTLNAIVVTAEAREIADSWVGQLADGGRLVVPLARDRAVAAFELRGAELHRQALIPASFVPLR